MTARRKKKMTTATKARQRTRSRRASQALMKEALEFVANVQRLERENIPIFPDHPPLH